MGRLRADLRARGLSVSTPDAHVAQCALDVDGLLLTEDAVFAKIAHVAPLRLAGAAGDEPARFLPIAGATPLT